MSAKEGKYVYAIVANNQDTPLCRMVGLNNQTISSLPYKDIAAVTSPLPMVTFDKLEKEELERFIAAHEEVNRKIAFEHDLIPMKFGMIVEDEEKLLTVLQRAYLQFSAALEHLVGKTEFVLEAFWDERAVIQKIAAENQRIKELQHELQSKIGLLKLPAKIKLGKYIFETLEERHKQYREDVMRLLRSCCPEIAEGKLFDKEMIINYSLLVDKHREAELGLKIDDLGERYHDELKFKLIGPMPPYSFSNVNITLNNVDVITRAKETLGLLEEATLTEIKKTYHELASQYHPDKYGGSPDTEEQMKKITEAHTILQHYCRDYRYSFRKEDIEKMVLVH